MTSEFVEGVIGHINAVRSSIVGLRDTTFIINCEANMAYAAPTLSHDLQARTDLPFKFFVLRRDLRAKGNTLTNDNRAIVITAGSRLDNARKAEMVHVMTNLLNHGRVRFHSKFVSTFLHEPPDAYLDLRAVIARQFRAFRRRYKPPPKGKELEKYAKTSYESAEKDDFVIATMMSSHTIDECERIPELRRLLGRTGM